MIEPSHFSSVSLRRNISGRCSSLEINKTNLQPYPMKDYVKEKIVPIKDLMANKNADMQQFKKLRGKLAISQNKEIQQLMYDRRARNLFVSLLSLVHFKSGTIFQNFTKHNHLTLSPTPTMFWKTVRTLLPITKLRLPLLISELYQQLHSTMKFKTEIPDPEDKNISEQQRKDSCTPQMVKPLTIGSPSDSKRKTGSKSTAKKRKPVKKGKLKEVDIHFEENPLQASEDGITAQESKNYENGGASRISPNATKPEHDKGNSNAPLISDVPESGGKLGLENMNDVIDSLVSMDMNTSNDGKVTNIVVPIKEHKASDVEKNVELNVETPLGQQDK